MCPCVYVQPLVLRPGIHSSRQVDIKVQRIEQSAPHFSLCIQCFVFQVKTVNARACHARSSQGDLSDSHREALRTVANMAQSISLRGFSLEIELLKRREPLKNLYVVVDGVGFPTFDSYAGSIVAPPPRHLRAKHNSNCANITIEDLRMHISQANYASNESQFISTFETEGRCVSKNPKG